MCSRISSTVFCAAISSQRVPMSMPKKQGCVIGGAVMRMCTSRAPALRSICDHARRRRAADDAVVDEHDALALQHLAQRVELQVDARSAHALVGLMNVRPT